MTSSEVPRAADAHRRVLETLARAEPARLKALAETLLPALGEVEVLRCRTGLVMAPMRDTVEAVDFHLGEALAAEAYIRAPAHLRDGAAVEGYGLLLGRDLERAMAMAVVDAAWSAGLGAAEIDAFVDEEAARLAAEDAALLRRVEATRVDMETF